MRATTLAEPAQELIWCDMPMPQPADQDILLDVPACGISRTDCISSTANERTGLNTLSPVMKWWAVSCVPQVWSRFAPPPQACASPLLISGVINVK